jgi:DNA-binding transcriptional LysR family regulator
MKCANTPELMEEVLRGHLHLALGVQPVQDRDLWVEPIAREGFSVCLSKNHALATRPSVSSRDLHGQSLFWIPRKQHPAFYDEMVEYIESTGAHPVWHEVASTMQAIDIAARGFGIAFLTHAASRLSHPRIVFKPVTDRFLEIETAIFARRDLLHSGLQEFVLSLTTRMQSLKLNYH